MIVCSAITKVLGSWLTCCAGIVSSRSQIRPQAMKSAWRNMFRPSSPMHSPHKPSHLHSGRRISVIIIGLATVLLITVIGQMFLLFKDSQPITSNGKASLSKSPLIRSVATQLPARKDDALSIVAPSDKPHPQTAVYPTRVQGTRVAIIVIYVGSSLPAWFDAFAQTAAISDALFDWLLFVTKAPLRRTPRNVKMIQLTEDEIFAHFSKLVDGPLDEPFRTYDTTGVIKHLLTTRSYLMVEFKPALGYLFSDYLHGYTHWAYADIDQLLGRMHPLISVEILNNYDIYTSCFGDNFRMYMRGQLTIHKNNAVATNLFKGCAHFTEFKHLLTEYLRSGNRSWHFESAEGCYSRVVADAMLNDKQVKVYFGATQATDAYGAPFTDRETILLNNNLIRCYTKPLDDMYTDADEFNSEKLIADYVGSYLSTTGHIESSLSGPVIDTPSMPWQSLELAKYRCSYWVKEDYEVCFDHVPAAVDVQAVHGVVKYQNVDRYRAFNGTCRESAISHFQAWKQNYLASTTRPPPPDTHAVVLSEFGFVPYRLTNPPVGLQGKDGVLNDNNRAGRISAAALRQERMVNKLVKDGHIDTSVYALKTFGQLLTASGNAHLIDAGKLAAAAVREIFASSSSKKNDSNNDNKINKEESTVYCGGFSSDLKKCVCAILFKHIEVVHIANNYEEDGSGREQQQQQQKGRSRSSVNADITFITAAWAGDFYSGGLDAMIDAWGTSQKIVVLARSAESDDEVASSARRSPRSDVTIIEVQLAHCPHSPTSLPDKMLYNIGLDAAATEVVVVVPAGIVLDLPIPGAKGTPASHSAVYSLTDELRLLHHGVDGKAAGWGPAVIVFPTYFPASSSASNGLSSGNDNSQRNYISNNALPVIYPLPNATKETREMFGVGDICAANAHDQSHELRKEWDHHDYKGTKSMLLQEISHIPTIWNQGPKFVNKEQAVAVITVEDEPGHVRKVEIGRTLVDVDNDVNEIKNKRIHFRRNDLTRANTLMLPIMFNTSSSPHGRGFTRFPEELGGVGCYGTAMLRALVGSGYTLVWANSPAFFSRSTTAGGVTLATHETCECVYGDDEHPEKAMEKINNFFLRVVHIRQNGLQGIHVKPEFGKNFEEEQSRLMHEAGLP